MNTNISSIIFTNEKYINIFNITLPRFKKYLKDITKNIYVVTNKFNKNTSINFEEINVIDANVNFSASGNHFAQSMLKALRNINTEYILFFCDDYMINSKININNFYSILNIIKSYNCDFFSFASLNYCDHIILEWPKIETHLNKFQMSGGTLYKIPNSYRHLYSVQPCIWKKQSFIELLEYNPELSISSLDNTNIKNKKGYYRNLNYETNYYDETDITSLDYNFTNLIINYPPLSYNIDDRPIGSNYLVFDYGEIIRHGRFIETETNSKKILMEFLKNNQDLKEKVKQFL